MAPKRNRFRHLENPIDLNQKIMDAILKEGDTVVDATCGNGYDSIFIAERIGKAGTLYCFDIQESAITKTKERLEKLENNKPDIQLLKDSHENMENYIKTKIDCAFYNLGYLPTSDKSIITKGETTIKSLNSVFNLLKPNGVISILSYLEHDNQQEYQQLRKFLSTLDQNSYSITETNFILRKSPPILFLIEKL